MLCLDGAAAQDMPLGGRTATMGGAGTASGRDGAMPYINPAGYARVPSTTLSLSASLYRYERTQVDAFFFQQRLDPALGQLLGQPTARNNQLVSAEFKAFPGAASLLWHFGPDAQDSEAPNTQSSAVHHVLSASILVVDSAHRVFEGDFALVFADGSAFREDLTYVQSHTEYQFGPGYAVRVGPVRLGANVMVNYTTQTNAETVGFSFFSDDDFGSLSSTNFQRAETFSLQPIAGAQVSLKQLSLGASLALPSMHVYGAAVGQDDTRTITVSGGPPPDIEIDRYEGSAERNFPLRARVGIAVEKPKSWAVAFDVGATQEQTNAYVVQADERTAAQVQGQPASASIQRLSPTRARVATLGLYGGAEFYTNDTLSIRTGGYYEPSPFELQERAEELLTIGASRFGVSLGLGLESQLGEVTFGMSGSVLTGNSIALDLFSEAGVANYRTVDARGLTLNAFIAGAVDVGEFSTWANLARDPAKLFEVQTETLDGQHLMGELQSLSSDPELRALTNLEETYPVSGVAEFDDFFREVARLRLNARVASGAIDHVVGNLQRLRKGRTRHEAQQAIADAWRPASDGVSEERLESTVRVYRVLDSVGQRLLVQLARLPVKGQRLVKAAQHRLAGPDLPRMGAVLRQVADAQAELNKTSSALTQLARRLPLALSAITGAVDVPDTADPIPFSRDPMTLTEALPVASALPLQDWDALRATPVDSLRTSVLRIDQALRDAARIRAVVAQAEHVRKLVGARLPVAEGAWRSAGREPDEVLRLLQRSARSTRPVMPMELRELPQTRMILEAMQWVNALREALPESAKRIRPAVLELDMISIALENQTAPELRTRFGAPIQRARSQLGADAARLEQLRSELETVWPERSTSQNPPSRPKLKLDW